MAPELDIACKIAEKQGYTKAEKQTKKAIKEFSNHISQILKEQKAANLILADSLRWRKVEEELPEEGFRVLIRNSFNVVHMGYIDTCGEWRYCLNHHKMNDKPVEWKPIN